jgi:hypothetical protein
MIVKDAPIVDFDGVQLKNTDGSDATLIKCMEFALLTLQGPVGGEENFKRFMIAKKLHEGTDIALEDAVVIKDACAKVYSPMAYGRIVEALEAR